MWGAREGEPRQTGEPQGFPEAPCYGREDMAEQAQVPGSSESQLVSGAPD